MASSSTNSFLLLFPLILLVVVDSGSVPTTPAPAATAAKYHRWCRIATDSPSCIKLIESIPGIQEVGENDARKVAELCLHLAVKKTTEAKGAADTLLAAAKGKPSSCLKVCAGNISSMAEVLVNPPTGHQDDMMNYLPIIRAVRVKFKQQQRPPACEKDCWNKTSSSSSSADETGIVDKFHDIWTLVQVGNLQLLNCCFLRDDDNAGDNGEFHCTLSKTTR